MMWIPKNSQRKNYSILRVMRDREYWAGTLLPAIDDFRQELQSRRLEPGGELSHAQPGGSDAGIDPAAAAFAAAADEPAAGAPVSA